MAVFNKRLSIVISLVAVALAGAAVYLFLRPSVEVPKTSEDEILPRVDVATMLGKIEDAQAVDSLKNALVDSSSAIRAQAVVAMGQLGHPRALPDLISALSDSNFFVRIRAVSALASMDYLPTNEKEKQRYSRELDAFFSVVNNEGAMADDPLIHLDVGQVYEYNKAFDKALHHYRYALRLAPDSADAQDHVQRLLEEEARYQKLVKIVTPVIEKEVRAQVALGLAYVHRGKLSEGVALLQKAVGAGVRSEIVETGLGDAKRKLGHFDMARKHYETALTIGPGFSGAHRGLALLDYSRGDAKSGHTHWDAFMRSQNNASDGVKQLMEKR